MSQDLKLSLSEALLRIRCEGITLNRETVHFVFQDFKVLVTYSLSILMNN